MLPPADIHVLSQGATCHLPSGTPAWDTGTACRREFNAGHKRVMRHQPVAPADTPAGGKKRFFLPDGESRFRRPAKPAFNQSQGVCK